MSIHGDNNCAPGGDDEPVPRPSNGDRRPPSPPPLKSPRRRPRTPPSRERDSHSRNYDRRQYYSPPKRRRSRSRSPEYNRRSRRSRSTSRGRRDWSPRDRRRRAPLPPQVLDHGAQNVPAYVPQPLYGDQGYQAYNHQQYIPGYNATGGGVAGFDLNYGPTAPMMANNPYMSVPYVTGTVPPPPAMTQDYGVHPAGWGGGPGVMAPVGSAVGQPVMQQMVKPKDDAVALEMEQQKATLRKQREDYEKRRVVLRRELKILKEQRTKLTADDPPSPTTKNFLKENDRLLAQIENKMSTIDNVIEMLTNIIGKEPDPPGVERTKKKEGKKRRKKSASSSSSSGSSNEDQEEDDDSEPEKLKTKVIESMKQRSRAKEEAAVPLEQQVNYAFYDPELHWCKSCNVFPKTAKDYLQHLHSKEHVELTKKSAESPWHENNPNVGMPTYNGAPTQRKPIRGLQFFVPATTAWYCKLCSIWMGDLHCASLHLKSKCHSDSISKFAEHNPDFEIDWMTERQEAYDTSHPNHTNSSAPPATDSCQVPFEGIPLQLNLLGKSRTASESEREPKKDKKSSKKKLKKEKSSKKRGKKRGKSSGSSSSSSSDTDSSSSSSSEDNHKRIDESERMKVLLSLSKRQQERQEQAPPSQTASIRNQMRKMEPENPETDRRSRRRESDDEQEQRRRKRKVSEDDRRRSRSRSPFDNRYRDRGRNRSRERQYRRRDSRSRSPAYRRRRSRTRSRSRSPRRIEKAVVNYPPQFKPRVPEKKPSSGGSDKPRRSTPPLKKAPVPATWKKLPFIGRMPVFKKQAETKEEEKSAVTKQDDETESSNKGGAEEEVEEKTKAEPENNDDDELMPDPEQLQRLIEHDQHAERSRQQREEQEEEILPPGIDESESDLIPKPINDAPVPRRGPLPKDLEDALNIIFPGEKPPGDGLPERKPFVVTGHIKDNGTEIITGPEPEDEVAQNTAAMYQAYSEVYAAQQQELEMGEESVTSMPRPEEEMNETMIETNVEGEESGSGDMAIGKTVPSNNSEEMDDLAMLGIDASDLAAQCV